MEKENDIPSYMKGIVRQQERSAQGLEGVIIGEDAEDMMRQLGFRQKNSLLEFSQGLERLISRFRRQILKWM